MNKIIEKIQRAIKKGKKELPSVDIVCLDKTILSALENSHMAESTVSETLALILRELGITKGQVTISNYRTYAGMLGYNIVCSKDNKPLFRLGFDYGNTYSKTPKLIVEHPNLTHFEYEVDYELDEKQPKLSLTLVLFKYKCQNSKTYTRKYSPEEAEYIIAKEEQEIILQVLRPDSLLTNSEENYRLQTETQLVDYLLTLEFPVNIDEIYKKIYEISIGENIDKYPFVHLYTTLRGKTTNSLIIENGMWQSFTKTKDGKTLTINQDGTWKCALNDYNTTNFSINCEKNGISLNVNAKTTKELDDYINGLASYDINTAKTEVESAKKLVRQITHTQD